MITSNEVTLVGELNYNFAYDHTAYDEKFYKFYISVARTSGAIDKIPVMISENLIPYTEYNPVKITGQFRSYNDDQGRLILYVFATTISATNEPATNNITLNGYLCKTPTHRTTPLGRNISDLLLAIPRATNKSDYIPIVMWGRLANETNKLDTGNNIVVKGRIQSREYNKNNTTNIAYEVSGRELILP